MKSSPNIYTVMVAVAFVALVFGIVFVWMQNVELTGEEQGPGFKNPFYLVETGS